MRTDILASIQIVISFLIIISVLMQQRSGGTGSLLGGSSVISGGEFYRTKVGLERFLSYFTAVLAILLVVTSFLYFFI